MTENRQHPRAKISLPVLIHVGEEPAFEAIAADLSLGGMFIETTQPAAYGTAIKVRVALPGVAATLEATVRWTKPDGMGVQFGSMGARETHGITLLLAAR